MLVAHRKVRFPTSRPHSEIRPPIKSFLGPYDVIFNPPSMSELAIYHQRV
jgi:hypothetical protein